MIGNRLAFVQTDFYGAPGALYSQGADIVIAYSPAFGNPAVPKFTIAGKNLVVRRVLPAFAILENGWQGPATGTILGSPRTGSRLSPEQVIELVVNCCSALSFGFRYHPMSA